MKTDKELAAEAAMTMADPYDQPKGIAITFIKSLRKAGISASDGTMSMGVSALGAALGFKIAIEQVSKVGVGVPDDVREKTLITVKMLRAAADYLEEQMTDG